MGGCEKQKGRLRGGGVTKVRQSRRASEKTGKRRAETESRVMKETYSSYA